MRRQREPRRLQDSRANTLGCRLAVHRTVRRWTCPKWDGAGRWPGTDNERCQNEGAYGQQGMGDRQPGSFESPSAAEETVQVDESRILVHGADASQGGFDLQADVWQTVWRRGILQFNPYPVTSRIPNRYERVQGKATLGADPTHGHQLDPHGLAAPLKSTFSRPVDHKKSPTILSRENRLLKGTSSSWRPSGQIDLQLLDSSDLT